MLIPIISACAPRWKHPNFEARQSEIRRIAVLPIDIEVYRLTFTGEHEELVSEEKMVRLNTIEAFDRALRDKGYTVTQLDTSPETLDTNPMLRDAYHKVKGELEAAMRQIAKGHNKDFKYNVGPEINILADAAETDALLMVTVDAFKKSGGQISKDVAKTVLIAVATLGNAIIIYSPSGALIQIAVIDGDNGDILWFNRNVNNQSINVTNKGEVDAALRGLIKDYPPCSAPKQIDDVSEDSTEPASSTGDTDENMAPVP